VWLYFRFALSLRDAEELLAQRGIEVSYETIRCWTIEFSHQFAANLSRRRMPPSPRWHLDEMVCSIAGKRWFLWRAVDDEGVVLDMIMQKGRGTAAALRLLTRLPRTQSVAPDLITTDGLRSYAAALDLSFPVLQLSLPTTILTSTFYRMYLYAIECRWRISWLLRGAALFGFWEAASSWQRRQASASVAATECRKMRFQAGLVRLAKQSQGGVP
jgi:hypothetical protein